LAFLKAKLQPCKIFQMVIIRREETDEGEIVPYQQTELHCGTELVSITSTFYAQLFALVEPKRIKEKVMSSIFLCFRDLRAQKHSINMLVKSTTGRSKSESQYYLACDSVT